MERAKKPVAACAEDIMILEEFTGTTHDEVYVPSQEESDVEIEGETAATEPTVMLYDSEAEDGFKYSKHFLNPRKFVG